MSTPKVTTPSIPYKQIRALYDEATETITVYQAYSAEIASAAVAAQKPNVSPKFRVDSRMTWIKPSWGWVLYRAGYSYKDKGQERILAIKMRKGDFESLLRGGVLTTHSTGSSSQLERESEMVGDVEGQRDSATGSNTQLGGTEETSPAPQDESPKDTRKGRWRTRRRDKSKQEGPKSESVKIQWDPERSVRLERLNYRSIQIGIPGCLTKQWCEEMIVGIEDVTDKARELKRVLDADDKIELEELAKMGLVPLEKEFEVPADIRKLLGMDLPTPAPAPGGEGESGEGRE